MNEDLNQIFIDSSIAKLERHTSEIERCLARLDDSQVWLRRSEHENAIGNLIVHLCGNVSQRTAIVRGEPDTRVRDLEFSVRGGSGAAALSRQLRQTIDDAVAVLRTLPLARLSEHVKVGEFDHTILESTYHLVTHFALHAGQIMFATKMITGASLGFYQPPASATTGR